jgi:hypothetical protein
VLADLAQIEADAATHPDQFARSRRVMYPPTWPASLRQLEPLPCPAANTKAGHRVACDVRLSLSTVSFAFLSPSAARLAPEPPIASIMRSTA